MAAGKRFTKNSQMNAGKNWQDSPALGQNFQGAKPADASAPLIDGGGKFTPATSQSNIRGKQGQ